MECLLCKTKSQKAIPLCLPCQKDLPWHKAENIAFYYKSPIDHWITQLKFHHQLQYAHLLGTLCVKKFKQRQEFPDILLPIPLHTRRLCQRGFNQAIEIAKPISRQFEIPLDRKLLKRTRHTKPQTTLPENERISNMAGAFHCIKQQNPLTIALFDDVMTTGSTLNAASLALHQQGIQNIEIWCCAKT